MKVSLIVRWKVPICKPWLNWTSPYFLDIGLFVCHHDNLSFLVNICQLPGLPNYNARRQLEVIGLTWSTLHFFFF